MTKERSRTVSRGDLRNDGGPSGREPVAEEIGPLCWINALDRYIMKVWGAEGLRGALEP